MKDNLFSKRLKEKGLPFLIMTHRGHHGGNIIMNTLPSVELSIRAGSDIVEVDICRSADGEYYLFHDGNEMRLLGVDKAFSEMTSDEIDSISLINSANSPSGFFMDKLTDLLEWLPENYLINIDRSWFYWNDSRFVDIITTSGKLEQLLLKSPAQEEWLQAINAWPETVNYMPILHSRDELALVESFDNINLIGLELIVKDLNHNEFDPKWMSQVQEKYLIMYNAEDLGENFKLFNRLTDTGAILEDPDEHWGEMIRQGGTIIQTDWPHFMSTYREEKFASAKI